MREARHLQQLTIKELWEFLLLRDESRHSSRKEREEEFREQLISAANWPPDVFCLVAAVLRLSGAYTWLSLENVAPPKKEGRKAICRWQREVQSGLPDPEKFQTAEVVSLLLRLAPVGLDDHPRPEAEHPSVRDCSTRPDLLRMVISLLVMSDQACAGLGLPTVSTESLCSYGLPLRYLADLQLSSGEFGSTLCRSIHPSKARVLPKTHTPPSGRTLRSLSHHLCYVESDEGRPLWYTVPAASNASDKLNILLIPYPPKIKDECFTDSRPLQGDYSTFAFAPEETCGMAVQEICELVAEAKRKTPDLNVVVLPELALSAPDYRLLRSYLMPQKIALIAGLGGAAQEGNKENRLAFDVPLSSTYYVHFRQRKHHPWRIDEWQIKQYGLGGRLQRGEAKASPTYWEDLRIGDRNTCFVALHPRILASVLICEDLAQYEPVGRLIRAVGPNLVVALLLDGPQISGRWPERYATVLSDDPGSSVLTLTALGMSERSKPRELLGEKEGKEDGREESESRAQASDRSRVIALWKDPDGKTEIELEPGSSAVLLEIAIDEHEEWTADLRPRKAVSLRLQGKPIQISRPNATDTVSACGSNGHVKPREAILISPVEASALARLARLQVEAPMEEWHRHYIEEILPCLGLEGKKIAQQMLYQKLEKDLPLPGGAGLDHMGPEEQRQAKILQWWWKVEWEESPAGREQASSTAREIGKWAEALKAY